VSSGKSTLSTAIPAAPPHNALATNSMKPGQGVEMQRTQTTSVFAFMAKFEAFATGNC
jgi:hypothetical protein